MAFLQSGPARQPVFRAPAVVLGLIAILVVAHAARTALSPAASADLIGTYAFIPARYAFPGTLWDRAVPFVSYLALHNDWTHVGINCLWLLAFGPVVARRFGPLLFLLFFLMCGTAGAGLFLAFNWGGTDPVIGASGAISGLMGAGIRLLPGRFPWTAPDEVALAPVWSRQVLIFTVAWTALNILAGTVSVGLLGENGPIAWQAHLGGYFAGLLLAGLFDRLRSRPLAPPLGEG